MNLGKRISSSRKKLNLTQDSLANTLYVTNKTISSWEQNRTEPNLEMIIKLSEVLNCSASYLIYGNNTSSNIETEIKIKITEQKFKELETFMKNNANFINKTTQIDTYYEPTHRKFLKAQTQEITEWLRIGIRGNKKILNYKNWYKNMYCDEYEVEIDNEKNLDKILKILGLVELTTVNKTRSTYLYQDKYEIALDYVKELGYFVEIEVKKYNTTPLEEYDNLLKAAKKLNLNLNDIDKRGYPYHLIYKDI